jgi:hypothetical protein
MHNMSIVFEDPVSHAIIERILGLFPDTIRIGTRYPSHGYGNIKANIEKYNTAARHLPFFILTDLDTRECAPGLKNEWLPRGIAENLLFRVAVREVESWLLADRKNFARLLRISVENITREPDTLPDPKEEVFRLVRRSRSRSLKEDILPSRTSRIGPGYNTVLPNFIRDSWNPEIARTHSPSLDKTIRSISAFCSR